MRDTSGRFRTIDVPGAYATAATRINELGQIAGDYWETKEKFEQGLERGFLLDRGRLVRVDVPGADSTEAVGIDNRGRVVGESYKADGTEAHGYLWDGGRITLIDVPGAAFAGTTEIDDRGRIGVHADQFIAQTTHGFLLSKGRYTTFDAPGGPVTQVFGLNNRGQIVGYVAADQLLNDAHGFLLAQGVDGPFTPIDVPGAPRTLALGINDRGQIVGAYENPNAGTAGARRAGTQPLTKAVHAFVKDRRGRLTSFVVPGGGSPLPQGINDRGRIAGIYLDSDGTQTGFVRDRNGTSPRSVSARSAPKARDVNDQGDVVGIYGEPAANELGYVVRGYSRERDGKGNVATGINDRGGIVIPDRPSSSCRPSKLMTPLARRAGPESREG